MKFLGFILIMAGIFLWVSRADVITFFNQLKNHSVLEVGSASLDLEVADTDTERTQGLSGKKNLKKGTGLLFVFEKEGYHGIWMKDMNFPIDIIWLDKNKKIIHIENAITPDTYPKIFYPPSPDLYVLETNANFFNDFQLNIGDVAKF